jgi:hypothetical protein
MAQLLSSNVSGNLIVSQNTTVSGNLIVAGYNILDRLSQGDNTSRVTANSASAQSAVSLNFVNTATVTVSVTSGGTGVANVAFTSTSGGTGTVTQVNSGLGLTGGPITSSGTLSANIASTTVQGITKLIDAVNSTDSANAATGAAVKTAYDQATLGYGQANAAFAQANTANSVAIAAYGQANVAFTAANNAANTVRVTANSGSTQSAVSLNFNNTASIQVSVGAGSAGNANVAFNAVSGSTTTAGILQLNDTVGSTSTTTAATPNIVQLARTVAIDAFSAANSAANTSQVSANGGSTLSKVSLNFNNTATIRVSVGSGSGSNANISFDYIGSTTGGGINTFPVSANAGATVAANGINFVNSATVTVVVSQGINGNANVSFTSTATGGGGGINNFPVSTNSGSTVTANGLNFVNSSSVTVSVSSGTAGNANISFISSNQFYSGLSVSRSSNVKTTNSVNEWVHGRLSYSNNIPGSTGTGVYVRPEGNTVYVSDSTTDFIYQIPLSQAWNIATAGVSSSFNVATQEVTVNDLSFKIDGTVLYILGDSGNDITWYTLGTAWDVTTASFVSQFSVSGQTTAPTGLFMRTDGLKFWVTSASVVYAYTMSSAWDLTTASYDSVSKTVSTEDTSVQAVSFSADGAYMYLVGATNNYMYEYALSTPWNISTAVYTDNRIRTQDTGSSVTTAGSGRGMFLAAANNRMYYLSQASDQVIEYTTNDGMTVQTKKMHVTGKGSFDDDVVVRGDLITTEAGLFQNIFIGSSAPTGGAGAESAAISSAGAISSSASTADIGTGTANATFNFGTGATVAGRIKDVNIGTSGVGGSITNITVGPVGVAANVNVNANTATFSNTVNVANQLIVSGLNIINELAIADNTVRVSVNSVSTLSNKYLNFVNTATVTVTVTDAGDGNANIAFTSSGSSGVTSVGTGLGLTGGPITSTGTISANIASTTVQGITKLVDVTTSTDSANAATANSVKVAFDQATSAYEQANSAYTQANAAFTAANNAANTVRVTANSGAAQSAVSLNFINTHNIIVSVGAGVVGTANVGFTVNTSKIIFVGTTAPSSPAIGDLWVDTN